MRNLKKLTKAKLIEVIREKSCRIDELSNIANNWSDDCFKLKIKVSELEDKNSLDNKEFLALKNFASQCEHSQKAWKEIAMKFRSIPLGLEERLKSIGSFTERLAMEVDNLKGGTHA